MPEDRDCRDESQRSESQPWRLVQLLRFQLTLLVVCACEVVAFLAHTLYCTIVSLYACLLVLNTYQRKNGYPGWQSRDESR